MKKTYSPIKSQTSKHNNDNRDIKSVLTVSENSQGGTNKSIDIYKTKLEVRLVKSPLKKPLA